MPTPKTPGIPIKLVAHQPSIAPPNEESRPIQKEEPDSDSKKPETQSENADSNEVKEVRSAKSEQKKTPIKQAESKEKTNKKPQPVRTAVPVESQQTLGKPVEELAHSEAENSDSDEFQQWLAQLQYRINRNKTYPYQAKRRRLEGEVKLKAEINSDGTLAKASMLAGKKAFETSSLRAIERSLPLPPPHKKSVTVTFIIKYQLL
ncbi:MAG: TonB family protein [Endozoicomonas sp.]|uniref:TonB family protein n=1 Tax=Endozoicomonas sp. TaxID=1892382 RepID=UPI003D9B11DA